MKKSCFKFVVNCILYFQYCSIQKYILSSESRGGRIISLNVDLMYTITVPLEALIVIILANDTHDVSIVHTYS